MKFKRSNLENNLSPRKKTELESNPSQDQEELDQDQEENSSDLGLDNKGNMDQNKTEMVERLQKECKDCDPRKKIGIIFDETLDEESEWGINQGDIEEE